jgi:RNA polymerase-binding transcription factor DksA
MGDIPENEQAWQKLARAKGYKCEACGELIPFSERQVFFERKLCGRCAASLDKKD